MNTPNKRLVTLAILASLSLTACNESTSSTAGADFDKDKDTTGDFDQGKMVTAIVDNIITPTYQNFSAESALQATAISAYCDDEKSFNQQLVDQATLEQSKASAKSAWQRTMNAWQHVEVMQMGALLEQDGLLRNQIYSWPVVNSCAVDFDVVYFDEGSVNDQPYDIALRTPSRKGMAALEYLLFNNDLNHSCTGSSVPPGWDSYLEAEKREARCNFATEVASDIQVNANSIVTRWLASDGFANELKQAGTSNSAIESEHAAVNLISDAMFYVDSSTKDGKLAIPIGILANSCGLVACPDDVESKFSKHSLVNIDSNLSALAQLLTGGEGIGFTDYLIDEGDQATADHLVNAINNAKANLNNTNETLSGLLETNTEAATQVHTDVKVVTDTLKADFINSLALKLPKTSAGDND